MAYIGPSMDNKSKWLRATLAEAKSHLKGCFEYHQKCRSHAATKLPTRVIDVGPANGSKDPFLFVTRSYLESNEGTTGGAPDETGELDTIQIFETSLSAIKLKADDEIKYTTLSYCWGKSQNFITTIDNLETLKKKIPWDKLPLTIQDAIRITRGLGIRYIWVDALCIIQDSPPDWRAESTKMAEIYGGSFLTISAALGSDVHHGLMSSVSSDANNNNPRVVSKWSLQKDPLYSRAWALQERMLSPRILIFGSEELIWECYKSHTGGILHKRLPDNPSPDDWHTVVRDYTCRNLTDERDKLPALAGLASIYSQATVKQYIRGLWKETLILDLLWSQRWLVVGNIATIDPPEKYRAPSWSWASVNGNCMYYLPRGKDLEMKTELIASFPNDSEDGVENLVEGEEWLLVRGPLIRAKVKNGEAYFNRKSIGPVWTDLREVEEFDTGLTTISLEKRNNEISRSDTWCLLLGTDSSDAYGLVLVEAVEFGEGNYRRVGTFLATRLGWEDIFVESTKSDLLLI